LDAVALAENDPGRQYVFFAVGFETTTPATALAVCRAFQLQLENFSLLVSHVRVQPAMEVIADASPRNVDGFLAAGHVCTVAGFQSYEEFARRFGLPVVVTGFEPVDLHSGVLRCVELLELGETVVENCYQRSVSAAGNRNAVKIVEEVFEICDRQWRGLGEIRQGGLRLRDKWSQFDAARRYVLQTTTAAESDNCRAGDVLSGRIKPTECEHFGGGCTPETPLGAPMVSAEGACAAYFRYAARDTVAKRQESQRMSSKHDVTVGETNHGDG
jgi:hydrogenase expression/formation protein HypD